VTFRTFELKIALSLCIYGTQSDSASSERGASPPPSMQVPVYSPEHHEELSSALKCSQPRGKSAIAGHWQCIQRTRCIAAQSAEFHSRMRTECEGLVALCWNEMKSFLFLLYLPRLSYAIRQNAPVAKLCLSFI
jgi:hypothetical protein